MGTALILGAFLCASLCTTISFLNHFSFSHRGVAENAYQSGLILVLSCFDVSWLSLLATDAVAVREVIASGGCVKVALCGYGAENHAELFDFAVV